MSVLTLFSHLLLISPSVLSPRFPGTILYAFAVCVLRATCPANSWQLPLWFSVKLCLCEYYIFGVWVTKHPWKFCAFVCLDAEWCVRACLIRSINRHAPTCAVCMCRQKVRLLFVDDNGKCFSLLTFRGGCPTRRCTCGCLGFPSPSVTQGSPTFRAPVRL
jgi:hypothetical protein